MPATARHAENTRRHMEARRRATKALVAEHPDRYAVLCAAARAAVDAEKGDLPASPLRPNGGPAPTRPSTVPVPVVSAPRPPFPTPAIMAKHRRPTPAPVATHAGRPEFHISRHAQQRMTEMGVTVDHVTAVIRHPIVTKPGHSDHRPGTVLVARDVLCVVMSPPGEDWARTVITVLWQWHGPWVRGPEPDPGVVAAGLASLAALVAADRAAS